MNARLYEGVARWTFGQLLLLQPHVAVDGMFFDGAAFVIVCPNLANEAARDGKALRKWFDHACRPAAMPIRISERRPEPAEEIHIRTPTETADDVGEPRRLVDFYRDLSMLLPRGFPLLGVDEDDLAQVRVLVSRDLSGEESNQLGQICDRIGIWFEPTIEVRTEVKAPLPPSQIELPAARALPAAVPSLVRDLLAQDDDFWIENRRALLASPALEDGEVLSPWRDISGDACVVATTFPPQNIRSYLSLYSTVLLVAPLGEELQPTLNALGIKRKELTELVSRGHVRVLFPQALSRYEVPWVAELAEAGPGQLLFSRRLAGLTVADQRRRFPFLVPGDAFERRAALRILSRVSASVEGPPGVFLRALQSGLADYWAHAEAMLNSHGAMASINDGLVHVASAFVREVFNKAAFIELGAAAQPLQWAGAFGAHFSPAEVVGYSEMGAAQLLAALHSGVPRDTTPLARPTHFELVNELLVLDNDVSVFDLVEETRKGDLARLRAFVRTLVENHPSKEELGEFVDRWNAQVRHYEKKEDKLKKLTLGAIGLAGAAAATIEEVRQFVPFFTPLVPYLFAKLTEDKLPEEAAASRLLDRAMATLATVPPEAVLLSRVRKRVAGMKSSPSKIRSTGQR